MQMYTHVALRLTPVLLGLLLVPPAVLAGTANCPVEPASNVPIADGEVFQGTNCTLNTVGDIDSFVFNANDGDTYQLAVAINGAATNNVCLALYSPSAVKTYSGCSSVNSGVNSVVTLQKLTAAGRYTMDVTETSTGALNYAVSIERVYPFPPNAQPITLAKPVAGDIAELTNSNAFTFGIVTNSTYQVSATLAGGASQNLCMNIYLPGGTSPNPGYGCTSILSGVTTIQLSFTPPQAGTAMAFVYVAGNDGTANYTLEAACLVGNCPIVYPPCTLTDGASYSATSSTLTMNFTVGNKFAATWNAWLTYQNTMAPLFTAAQPITVPPVAINKTYPNLSPEGTVGILSTLTTPTQGITCSSWVQVNTGTP